MVPLADEEAKLEDLEEQFRAKKRAEDAQLEDRRARWAREQACIRACMHTYMHAYMHTCLHTCIHACIHAHLQ